MKKKGFIEREEGKEPRVVHYMNAVDDNVRYPLELAYEALLEEVPEKVCFDEQSDPAKKKIEKALLSIGAALRVWDAIDDEYVEIINEINPRTPEGQEGRA